MRSKFTLLLILFFLAISSFAYYYSNHNINYHRPNYNIVIIDIDALRADYLGATSINNKKLTPKIDKFAKNAFVYTNAISASSWTLPSTMSIFTGTYPSTHKVINKYVQIKNKNRISRLSKKIPTLAEALNKEGYRTAAFTGGAGLSPEFGFDRGFDTYFSKNNFASFNQTIPAAKKWLEKNKNKKFFLFLHGYDVHGMNPNKVKGETEFNSKKYKKLEELSLTKKISLTKTQVKALRRWYGKKVKRADNLVASFLSYLKNLRILNKTVVVILSDHGTELYDRGRIHHGFSLYDELIKVPLIIKIPQTRGYAIKQQVRTIDIMPTILDILNINPDKSTNKLDGVTLYPSFLSKKMRLYAFSETDYRLVSFKRAIRSPNNRKLIYDIKSSEFELYDLKKDPYERHNIYKRNSRAGFELEQKLLKHIYSDYEN